MKTAREFVDSLDDPDYIGASEYRIIHELLDEVANNDAEASPKTQLNILEGILDEIDGWSASIREKIKKELKS